MDVIPDSFVASFSQQLRSTSGKIQAWKLHAGEYLSFGKLQGYHNKFAVVLVLPPLVRVLLIFSRLSNKRAD